MENEVKYLISGNAVEVIEVLKSGYLVANIYEYDEGEIADVQNAYIVKEVYDTVPVEKKEQRIAELNQQIADKTKELGEINKKVWEAQTLEAESIKRWEKHSQTKLLNEFIDGKITHYVIDKYGTVDIVEFGSTTSEYTNSDRGLGKLKMLSLYGKANGNLTWRLNEYSDGSGSKYKVWPCMSYEEAIEKLTQVVEVRMQKYLESDNIHADYAIKSAQKYNIAIPEKVMEKFNRQKESTLRTNMQRSEESYKKSVEEYNTFTKSITN